MVFSCDYLLSGIATHVGVRWNVLEIDTPYQNFEYDRPDWQSRFADEKSEPIDSSAPMAVGIYSSADYGRSR
jgi:hypothetical protein